MAFPPPSAIPQTSLPLPHPDAYEGEPREYARALMQRKDAIEKEIDALKELLSSHGATGSTSLFDPEGFPRGDIDVYTIRHTRAALARLNTDRNTVNDLLAPALEAAFSLPSTSGSSGSSGSSGLPGLNGIAAPGTAAATANGDGSDANRPSFHGLSNGHAQEAKDEWPEEAVARVNTVAANSPAATAGLLPADAIHDFGGVTAASGRGLGGIGAVVIRSEGIPIPIKVLRNDQRVRLTLTPRNGWGGRGSLGCHILPV